MTNASILSYLRDVYDLNSTDYPDSKLTALITQAAKKISFYYPEICLSYITTVKDQSRYTITHENLMKIVAVYYSRNSEISTLFDDSELYDVCVNEINTYLPSIKYSEVQNQKLLDMLFPVEADIRDTNSFDLIPPPSESGKLIYYEYAKYRAIDDIPDIFEDDVAKMVVWYVGQRAYMRDISTMGGDGFYFDRRGNIQKQASIASVAYKQRQTEFNDIIKEIQKKLMGIR